ncbi:unnamed protein product [Phaedon cochleariae]|uniref:Prolyl 4-hydroxylase alpha subunit domain-containing protein n=1 Tax=Phaedon cochleariae TaxID=80249 RepID=A0A9N9X4W8_PHACE|nr:unnamed protein product [Phaedon cochleariae]
MAGLIAVHCGAGSHSSNLHNEYKRLCNKACRKGVQVMKEGGTAMEAIQAAVIILENDPLTNCGFGSNLTLEGMVENDASVMDGKTLAFGGCGAVKKIKNPIALAYDICVKQSVGLPLGLIPPSLLVGSGALKHAKNSGLKVVPNSSLVCKRALRQFKKYKALLDVHQENCERLDTVGAVCIDGKGDVAAACSSGGLILKKPGRVGQAALYASGTWADSLDKSTEPSVAVCTTGCGEYLIQTHLAKELAEDLKFNPNAMAFHKAMGVKFLKSKFLRNVNRKLGGALVVHRDNKSGEVSVLWGHTTDSMGVGYMQTKDSKPKSFICELPGYAVPEDSQCSNLRGEIECGEANQNNILSYFHNNEDVLVYTVATEETNGFQRYMSSAKEFNIQPKVLGIGTQWQGGNIKTSPAGGWKINLLKKEIKLHEEEKDKLVLFTDGYDVIFLDKLNEIVKKFEKTGAKVLFSAEPFCWPDPELASKYPEVAEGKRFLNSGMYIGYVPEILKLLEREEIADTDDDQLFFTKAYLDETFRDSIKMQLDHKSDIFQNLHGVADEIEVASVDSKESGPERYLIKNMLTKTEPSILHGNGRSKISLNYLGNYVPNTWNSIDGCKACKEGHIDLSMKTPTEMPVVVVSVFIEQNTPFLEEALEKLHDLDYPKEKIHFFIHSAVKYHASLVTRFAEKYDREYPSFKLITPDDGTSEWKARDLSLDHCLAKKCDFYFSVDSVAHIDNPHTLRLLIEQNRTVVAPMLVRPGKAWSNFWGSLTKDGFYARSNDYMDIVHNEKRGLWNVPFINNAYLVNATLLRKYDRTQLGFDKPNVDADMTFCTRLRDLDVFMFVSNRIDFGHLINADNFDTTRTEPEMYQIFDNEMDWENRYIHVDYPENFNPDKKDLQPCPDVYWFPIVSPAFCRALINMMETFGQWSSGRNQDDRLEGGYEAVPTRDIHANQVGWEKHWLRFLQKYARPLQEKVFTGYYHDPPRSLMNFVVRYRPDEQPSLRPHHDSSTYTVNVALNEHGKDYEGGGCRFIRYNCSVVDTRLGWLLIHPGRLTHYHEGLKVTNGTRYIMISFVDP